MIWQKLATYTSRWLDHTLMYPGTYVETWITLPGTGVSILLGRVPYEEAKA